MLRPGLITSSLRTHTILRTTARSASILSKLKPDFSKYKLKEQPPGYIVGGPNDAAVGNPYDALHGSYHWSYERAVAVALIPLAVTPFVAGVDLPVFDAVFSALLLIHAQAGFTSCITDYIPKRVYGVWNTFAMRLLAFGSIVSLYGIYIMETTDVGLYGMVSKLWEQQPAEDDSYLVRPRY
ncbi:hypothetical protein WICPIJ_004157 [Wickerhamomyces pijperi]|uniref:Succinate dehydrogenase [ubiquinone] cytochrome b small subunit n=1 Tax=Wickerhamomyces pijperi TaxID=599730 RepID=A0A9P8Q8K8_WICPI|nr:hypothetical protein WICPIJ_004157 [Wickerhamomyces pijperi]